MKSIIYFVCLSNWESNDPENVSQFQEMGSKLDFGWDKRRNEFVILNPSEKNSTMKYKFSHLKFNVAILWTFAQILNYLWIICLVCSVRVHINYKKFHIGFQRRTNCGDMINSLIISFTCRLVYRSNNELKKIKNSSWISPDSILMWIHLKIANDSLNGESTLKNNYQFLISVEPNAKVTIC